MWPARFWPGFGVRWRRSAYTAESVAEPRRLHRFLAGTGAAAVWGLDERAPTRPLIAELERLGYVVEEWRGPACLPPRVQRGRTGWVHRPPNGPGEAEPP